MVEVNWTPQSLQDIDNIAEFIARDSEKYARIQVGRFFDHVLVLGHTPKAGRIVPEIKKASVRELILGNYRIVYRIVSAKRVDIITVHHSARRLTKTLFKRKSRS